MDNYLLAKLIHILAAVVVTGTGAGIAFFMLMAVKSKNAQVIKVISKQVVLADWLFTAPAVIVQLLSGLYLMNSLNYSFQSIWFISVISLFIFIGLCWIPVIIIQYKMRNIAQKSNFNIETNDNFKRLFKLWLILGFPAFTAILVIFWLMVFKPISFF